MNLSGYTGISFPFRIGVRGGVAMSTTSRDNVKHLEESIQQILSTFQYERAMEPNFFSVLDTDIFEPSDISTTTLLKYQITNTLGRLEKRITVTRVETKVQGSIIYATIYFTVPLYNTEFSTRVKVGEI